VIALRLAKLLTAVGASLPTGLIELLVAQVADTSTGTRDVVDALSELTAAGVALPETVAAALVRRVIAGLTRQPDTVKLYLLVTQSGLHPPPEIAIDLIDRLDRESDDNDVNNTLVDLLEWMRPTGGPHPPPRRSLETART